MRVSLPPVLLGFLVPLLVVAGSGMGPGGLDPSVHSPGIPGDSPIAPAVANYTAAIQRIVTLLGLSGSGLLAIVWARVALSWFSNDVTKKIQAKDRARDALIGTILFTAAVSGLLFALAQWVVTGS